MLSSTDEDWWRSKRRVVTSRSKIVSHFLVHDSLAFQITTVSKFHCESIGSSDQLVVFYYFSLRKSFLLSLFSPYWNSIYFFLAKSGFRCYQFILPYFLLSFGSLGEAVAGVINKNEMREVIVRKQKDYFYFENASRLLTII